MNSDVATLLGMAKTAELGNNMDEALGYYNRVLEADPTNAEAWLGKGRSAGWQSSIVNFRIPEAIIAFNHAISNTPEDRKSSVKQEASNEVNGLVSALYSICRNHMEKFDSLPESWNDYLSQVRQMLDALDEAERWSPQDKTTLQNIIHLCKDNLEGHVSRDEFNYGAETTHGLTPEYENMLQDHLDHAVERMRALEPDYAAPQVEKKVGSDCFVVTATLDDNHHPDVQILRKLRDEVLLSSETGRLFVSLYIKFGPRAAYLIRRKPFLRSISRRCLVRPAALVARLRLGNSSSEL